MGRLGSRIDSLDPSVFQTDIVSHKDARAYRFFWVFLGTIGAFQAAYGSFTVYVFRDEIGCPWVGMLAVFMAFLCFKMATWRTGPHLPCFVSAMTMTQLVIAVYSLVMLAIYAVQIRSVTACFAYRGIATYSCEGDFSCVCFDADTEHCSTIRQSFCPDTAALKAQVWWLFGLTALCLVSLCALLPLSLKSVRKSFHQRKMSSYIKTGSQVVDGQVLGALDEYDGHLDEIEGQTDPMGDGLGNLHALDELDELDELGEFETKSIGDDDEEEALEDYSLPQGTWKNSRGLRSGTWKSRSLPFAKRYSRAQTKDKFDEIKF